MKTHSLFRLAFALALLAGCEKESNFEIAPESQSAPPSQATPPPPHEKLPHASPHQKSPHGPSPHAGSPHGMMPPAAATESDLEWKAPAGIEAQSSTSRMRLASFRIPKAPGDSEDGELAVFHFPGGGGSVDSNIQRWVDQFSDVSDKDVVRSERTVNGLKHHVVEIESGTFSSGMPMGPATPKKDHGLIAAVVETPKGPYFFKATGPKATLKRARGDVMAFFESIKTKS